MNVTVSVVRWKRKRNVNFLFGPTHALTTLRIDADAALEGTCAEVKPGGTIKADGKCYKLMFQASTLDTTFTVDTKDHKAVAFFTQHLPTEFERTEHYFKDVAGEDIEPVFQEPDPSAEAEEEKAKPWGAA